MLIDVVFAILMLLACLKGLRKGLIIALFSVFAFIAGLAAALKLSAVVANRISENITVSAKWLPVISFMVVFIAVVFLVNLGGRLIQKSVQALLLGWVDKFAGMILFCLLYSIIFSVFLFYAVQLHLVKEQTILSSQIYPYIQPIGPKVIGAIGSVIPFFKDIFAELQRFFGEVSNKMRH